MFDSSKLSLNVSISRTREVLVRNGWQRALRNQPLTVGPLRLEARHVVQVLEFYSWMFGHLAPADPTKRWKPLLEASGLADGVQLLDDPGFAADLDAALLERLATVEPGSAYELAVVHYWPKANRAIDPGSLGCFAATRWQLAGTRTRSYILPRDVIETLEDCELGTFDELFDSHDEADTTLSLWTPGSTDEFGDFEYAYATGQAL